MKALAVALVLVAACSSGALPTDRPATPVAGEPAPTATPGPQIAVVGDIVESRSDVSRQPPEAASNEQLEDLVAADRDFALALYQVLVETEQGNLFLSPYSISTALSMVLAGARGETADELASALEAGADQAAWHPARNRLELELARLADYDYPGEGDVTPLTLETVNSIFGQAGFPFEPEYLDVLAADYGAGMNAVDFAHEWEAARNAINAWVAERTRDRIPELLPQGSIDDLTRAVLVNAIYFKANWVHQFDPDKTEDGVFHLLGGSTAQVPMMNIEEKLQYAEGDGWQAVELPYWGSASMLVLVPNEGRFADLEGQLDSELLGDVDRQLSEHLVDLSFPRWESKSELDLIPPLRAMGVELVFDRVLADLTGIADVGPNLYVSGVFHDSFIAVDEEGTEAAAATAAVVGLESGAAPATLTVDRPFIYVIRDTANGEILFLGRLLEP